jgi:tRNA1(Val) A37 N6-methylase TrmN6
MAGNPFFSRDVLDLIPEGSLEAINSVIEAILAAIPDALASDVLGTIFHDLIPFGPRKTAASFYTDPAAADLLAWLAIDTPGTTVIDLACGSGGLLVAAYQRKKHMLEQAGASTNRALNAFIESDIMGVDEMPLAAAIAASNLMIQVPGMGAAKIPITVRDATTLHCEDLGLKDVVIMNPPFTRQERLDPTVKHHLDARFGPYAAFLHGQMGFYGYFIFLGDEFVGPGGQLALVLPATVLRTRSCKGIREFLASNYYLEFLIVSKTRLNFSGSTWKREILLVARKKPLDGEGSKRAVVAAIEELPNTREKLADLVTRLKTTTDVWAKGQPSISFVDQAEFSRNLDWLRFLELFTASEMSTLLKQALPDANKVRRFSACHDLKTAVTRGIETRGTARMQSFFIARDRAHLLSAKDTWFANEVSATEITASTRAKDATMTLPIGCTRKAVRTLSNLASMAFLPEGETDRIIVSVSPDPDAIERFGTDLDGWEKYVTSRAGNLVILRRFVVNAPGTIHLAYYFPEEIVAPGTAWVGQFPDEDAKILCLWFNSSLYLAQMFLGRVEDVWVDVHKYILESILIPDVASMPAPDKSALLKCFDRVREIEFPSLAAQYIHLDDASAWYHAKRDVDLLFLEVLGVPAPEAMELLKSLHAALAKEFASLQRAGKRKSQKPLSKQAHHPDAI